MFTLHNVDCLEYMKTLEPSSVDCIVTDPPYGINYMDLGSHKAKFGWNDHLQVGEWDKARIEKVYFDEILRVGKKVCIWGGNYYTDYLPPTMQWFIWDKGQRMFSLADFEMAWSSNWNASRIFDYSRSKALQDGKVHPTQKPIDLMTWCIRNMGVEPHQTVFDPFMGSGTTGVACMKLGMKFIGCEISPEYFAIAKKRIKSASLQPGLFTPSNNHMQRTANAASQQSSLFAAGEQPAKVSGAKRRR